jgi:hypothetical protein
VSHLIISQEEVRIKTVSIILIVLTEQLMYLANSKNKIKHVLNHNLTTIPSTVTEMIFLGRKRQIQQQSACCKLFLQNSPILLFVG